MKKKIGLVVAIIFIGALAFGISRVVQNPEQYQKTDPNIEAIMNSCEVTEAHQSVPSLPLKHLFLPDSCEPRKRRFKGQSVHTAGITQRRKEGKSIIVCPRYAGESRQIEVKSRISLSYRG